MRELAIRRGRRSMLIVRAILLALAGAIMVSQQECYLATSSEVGGPQLQIKHADRVNVYVYEDPVFDHTALIQCYRDRHNGAAPWQDERMDMAQDMGEIWVHQSLLSHPWRVLDPEGADVFFVPLYPVLSMKLLRNHKSCHGLNHQQRLTRTIIHLVKNSTYFNRFGGADHVVVCAWWNCKRALSPKHRMLLRRAVVGINQNLDSWSMWGCRERMVTVPYTASSALTTAGVLGGRSAEERDVPFTFVGSSRGRPERKHLQVVTHISPDSVIVLGDNAMVWSEGAPVYADNMSRSRFCFCPRGDTASSRRIFDAISAGCIPILTVQEAQALPFLRTGLNYSEFAVVTEKGSFSTAQRVKTLVKDLWSRSDEQLSMLREGLVRSQSLLVYGISNGPALADMQPFHGTASMFLLEVKKTLSNGGLWNCPSSGLDAKHLSPRTTTKFPPEKHRRRQWIHESETIVNREHSLLFCAPPNTGSLQFRMLAKRMEGVDHWTVSDDRSLLFDTVASELTLLDLADTPLMEDIYKDNGSGWIKIGVVRDPVTRLLSAYLDLLHAWPSMPIESPSPDHDPEQAHRGLRSGDGWEWFDAIRKHRGMKQEASEQESLKTGEHRRPPMEGGYDKGERAKTSGHHSRNLQHATLPTVPTFEELLDLLEAKIWAAPSAFRPAASLCGMLQSPFDTIIPFETLQQTSTKVLKSLPGDIWHSFGESGWGPEGKHAFMEYDYGTAVRHNVFADQEYAGRLSNKIVERQVNEWHGWEAGVQTSDALPTASLRARTLFSAGSCAWTEYYADQTTLDRVGHLYSADYGLFGWYDLDSWKERLEACRN